MPPNDEVEIYTDGACSGNPGPGGWGVLLRYRGHEKELFGSNPTTTNNRMELWAVIKGLIALKRKPDLVTVYSDSKYIVDGVNEWLKKWKSRGWRGTGGPIKNIDLWKRLDALVLKYKPRFSWVKGHNGNRFNERADELAKKGVETIIGKLGDRTKDSKSQSAG